MRSPTRLPASATTVVGLAVAGLAFVGLLPPLAAAIDVAANSPCASLCSNVANGAAEATSNADMVCGDGALASTTAGQRWTACVGCLQNSTYQTSGTDGSSASDLAAFLYNLRYSVDYCVFGYPNASDVGSNPCQTSTACGPLQAALYDGIPADDDDGDDTDSTDSTDSAADAYGFCQLDGGALVGGSTVLGGCLSCVSSGGDTNALANALVALEAACLQQPTAGQTVGLSGSVFATATTISVVQPTATAVHGDGDGGDTSSGRGTSHAVATTTIAVAVVGAMLAVAAAAGFGFVCHRKRRGSRRRLGSGGGSGGGGGGGGASTSASAPASASDRRIGPTGWADKYPSSEHITSPLSFQCRASVASLETVGGDAASARHSLDGGRPWEPSPTAGLPKQPKPPQQPKPTKPPGSAHGSVQHLPAIAESPSPLPSSAVDRGRTLGVYAMAHLPTTTTTTTNTDMTTTATPRAPPRLHQLTTSFSPAASSSPTSATALLPHGASPAISSTSSTSSTLSPSPALLPYNPAHYPYAGTAPPSSSRTARPARPAAAAAAGSSPLSAASAWSASSVSPLVSPDSSRVGVGVGVGLGLSIVGTQVRKARSSSSSHMSASTPARTGDRGSPVHSQAVQTQFQPPPRSRR